MQRLYQGLNRQPQEVASSFGNSLALGGERNVGGSLLFQVQASRARYWRAVTFDTFDGTQWLNTATETVDFAPGTIVPVAAWRAREAISQTVTLLAPVGDVLFGAPDVAQADISIKATVRPQSGVAPILAADAPPGSLPVEFAMLRASRDLDRDDRYTFVSAATDVTVQDLNSAGTTYPADIVDRYIQIPPDFSPRVAELGRRLTEGASTPYAKAQAIESYLRTIPYNDVIAAPPAGIDPLEYFLFDIQEGYCDYYAASMAMMLRVAGVPARTASGYAEGTFDEESNSYFVTEQDAHTWVEVYFPEYGWIEFEPTAGESPLNRPASNPDAMDLTSQTEPEPQPESPLPAPTPPGGRDEGDLPPPYTGEDLLQGGAAATGNPPLPWWLWALMLLLLIPAGAFLILRARNSGPTAFTTELPVLLFERMQRWMGRLGLEAQTGQTPYEHARRVGRALPETQPHVDAITGSYVRYRFSRSETSPAETVSAGGESLLSSWRLLEPLLWKAWLRRLRQRGKGNADNYRLLDAPGE
jgi:transglutaminase-like putative cysteine protease